MKLKANNYAFIDGQNLNLSIRSLGWKIDWRKFRIYLKDKYSVERAYMFLGFIEGNTDLYTTLQSAGFICIFRPTLKYKDGTVKGNCDAELVLQAMIDFDEYHKAILVTGDGDFHCLVKYLIEKEKLEAVIIPNRFKFSALLKFQSFRTFLRFLNDLKEKLGYKKEKTP
jgi:uncharacterized LabA/DUF88 family protein